MEKNAGSELNPPLASEPELPAAAAASAEVKNGGAALEESVVPPPEVKADDLKSLAVVESKLSLCIYGFGFFPGKLCGSSNFFLGKLISSHF